MLHVSYYTKLYSTLKHQSPFSSSRLFQRYLRVSDAITPERRRSDKRFGMAMSAFILSAKFQTTAKFRTEPA